MKNRLILITLFFGTMLYGQGQPEIEAKLPDIIPPSPTVAALMKFEEVPVNYYTGVPDINVPLFSVTPSGSKVGLNLSLKYHTNSTKLREKASDIGLGWSLVGAGSISRTVRGVPDEFYSPGKKYGVYHINQTGIGYYTAIDEYNSLPSMNTPIFREYLFEIDRAGMYDTQHDLWQYNFMGHSGRFYIEKNSTGLLEVKLLDNNVLKIINHYILPGTGNSNFDDYIPTGFTVFDDLGYRYEFNVVETTFNSSLSEIEAHNGLLFGSTNTDMYFNSSFHLTEVYDNNDVLLFSFDYTDEVEEHISGSNWTSTSVVGTDIISQQNDILQQNDSPECVGMSSFPPSFLLTTLYEPKNSLNTNTMIYGSKKVLSINIPGYGTLDFDYQTGREDDNYTNRTQVLVLKSISQSDVYGNEIKEVNLIHEYRNAISKKLFLKEIHEAYSTSNIEVRKFYYKETQLNSSSATEDGWGYLKQKTLYDTGIEADKDEVSAFALEKMVLPTGGSVVFQYESNMYSYIEAEPIINFDDNYYNWNHYYSNQTFSYLNQIESLFTITNSDNKVILVTPETIPNITHWWFSIYKDGNTEPSGIIVGEYCNINEFGQCVKIFENLDPGIYTAKLTTEGIGVPPLLQTPFQVNITVTSMKTPEEGYKNYFYGGGYRVSGIFTFEENVNPQSYTQTPLTETSYSYVSPDSGNSSGSLCSPKPIKYYQMAKRRPIITMCTSFQDIYITYNYFTGGDFINRSTTHGSEVGYKYVTVYQGINGSTRYTYTSPVDYPDVYELNGLFSGAPLFFPAFSMDYKRGLLQKREVFNFQDRILLSEENQYNFEDYQHFTGFQVYGISDGVYESSPTYKLFDNYGLYLYVNQNNVCNPGSQNFCRIDGGSVGNEEFVKVRGYKIQELSGWPKLSQKNTKQYFYEGMSQNIVETSESFTYNSLNKKIASHTVSSSQGDNLLTEYQYHTGNSVYSQNRISEIEQIKQFKNNDLIGTQKIQYNNAFDNNVSYLPQTISTAKGTLSPESKVIFTKYNTSGKVLELQQADGISISYIYAYHQTQPVAKLENISYSQIPAQLITAIQTATDAQSYNEQAVLSALTALRSDSALANAMITTYTYKPLVGVSSITDPKGYTTTYHYDPFGRLEYVKDADGNILSENEYHYRTQN